MARTALMIDAVSLTTYHLVGCSEAAEVQPLGELPPPLHTHGSWAVLVPEHSFFVGSPAFASCWKRASSSMSKPRMNTWVPAAATLRAASTAAFISVSPVL